MKWYDEDECTDWEAIKEVGGHLLLVVLVVATGYCSMFLR